MFTSKFANPARPEAALTDHLIRLTTLAVVAVASVAAIICYQQHSIASAGC